MFGVFIYKQKMEDCLICLDLIQDDYAVVNNEHERGIYHIHCLEKWLKDSTRGVLSREKPKSYIVFNNGVGRDIFTNAPTPSAPPLSSESTTLNIENQSPARPARLSYIIFLILILLGIFITVGAILYYL